MIIKAFTALACLTATLSAPSLFAAPKSIEEAIRALQGVPPPELPAQAAAVVNSAPRENRAAVATTVLQVVTQTQPASAPAVRNALVSAGVITAPKATAAGAPVALSPNRANANGNVNGNGNGNGNGNDAPKPPTTPNTPNTPNPNSRFLIAPPHGGNPPGQNGQPDRKGPPAFVDYSKPRSF